MIQRLDFPNTTSGRYAFVDTHSLIPFENVDGDINEEALGRYIQNQSEKQYNSNVEAEKIFLTMVFDRAVALEEEAKEKASQELKDYYGDSFSDDSDGGGKKLAAAYAPAGDDDDDDESFECPREQFELEEDDQSLDTPRDQFELADTSNSKDEEDEGMMDSLDAPYTQAITYDPDDFNMEDENSNEPIRPGDVIEYFSPIYVAGDKRGLRRATILAVRPKEEIILVLSNGEVLLHDSKVKRIKVMLDKELVEHPGIYRPIDKFRLVAAKGVGYKSGADGVLKEAARFGDILQSNVREMQSKAEASGFAPMDMVNVRKSRQKTAIAMNSNKPSPRLKETEVVLSSSGDDSSSDDERLTKATTTKTSPRQQQLSSSVNEIPLKKDKINLNKETLSNTGNKYTSGSPSSTASLGSSFASSSSLDSSGNASPAKAAKICRKSSSPRDEKKKKKKSNRSKAGGESILDLSLDTSSDIDSADIASSKSGDKRGRSSKTASRRSSSRQRSPSSNASASSNDGDRLREAIKKASTSSKSGSSKKKKRTPVLKAAPQSKTTSSSSFSVFDFSQNEDDAITRITKHSNVKSCSSSQKTRKQQKKSLSTSGNSDSTSDSDNNIGCKQRSTKRYSPSSSRGKSKTSYGNSSVDDIEDSDDEKPRSRGCVSSNGIASGWTQSTAGWTKAKGASPGFSLAFTRHKK